MRKTVAYILLLAFLVNTAGYFPLLELHKYMVRMEINSILLTRPSALTLLKIPDPENNPDFVSIHSREFIFQGRMYDIVSASAEEGYTTFLCLHDKKEENLMKGMKKSETKKFNLRWFGHQIKIASPPVSPVKAEQQFTIFVFAEPAILLPEVIPAELTQPPEQLFT